MNDRILELAKDKLKQIINDNNLNNEQITILVKTLTPEEAIGQPGRRDFPIVTGKERVIESELGDARAHVFTDSPGEFKGTIGEIMQMNLDTNKERALFLSALNVILKKLNLIDETIHCRDEEPEQCSSDLKDYILEKWGKIKIGQIGLNPAIAEALSNVFGSTNLKITDLDKNNINTVRFGVTIWDGATETENLVKESDLVVLTGTTLVNGTFDNIYSFVDKYNKDYLIYGVTATGVSYLFGLNRVCFYGHTS